VRYVSWWFIALGSLAFAGCDDAPPTTPKPPAPAGNSAAPLPSTSAAPLPTAPTAPVTKPAAKPAQTAAPPAAPKGETVKAEVGVGKQGRGYGGGMVTEPVRTYFRTQQAIAFQVQIPNAMKNFKALNDRNPKDWDEFKREILDASGINLPELPAGEKYTYDGKTGELMVERPAPTESPK
jgi:hypothetical protein